MFYEAERLEREHVSNAAAKLCAAARTAPKAKGVDTIRTAFVSGEDRFALADEVDRIGREHDAAFFLRDAECIRKADGVALIGTGAKPRGISPCGLCGFADCAGCRKANGRCALSITDLGIAVGSAVSIAADERVDNRVFFTAGVAAVNLGLLGEEVRIAYGIPLSMGGKSIFFDR